MHQRSFGCGLLKPSAQDDKFALTLQARLIMSVSQFENDYQLRYYHPEGKMHMKYALLLSAALAFSASTALAAETPEFKISIKDHKFTPDTIEVPADTKVKLIVKNEDPTPEEFESHDFNREKVIPGGATANIFVGPLKAGEYKFFGEFNEKTAQGKVIVK